LNNPNEYSDREGGQTRRDLLDELVELYRLPVPALSFDARQVAQTRRPRRWRPALFTSAAAASLLLFVAGSSMLDGGTPEVSAETIFERTKEVTATSATNLPLGDNGGYHMVSRSETSLAGGGATISETWFLDPEHQRSETRDAATGRILWGSARDGDDMWMYAEVDGKLTAVHSTVDQMAFGIAYAGFGVPGVTDLADLLDSFTSECSNATHAGEDVVAGRPAYVIDVTSKPDTCKFEAVRVTAAEHAAGEPRAATIVSTGVAVGGGMSVEAAGAEPNSVPSMGGEPIESGSGKVHAVAVVGGPTRMWIDQETFMMLRSESNFGDAGGHTFEVTSLELGDEFAAAAAFAPPAGAEVIEADSPDDANVMLKSLFTTSSGGRVEYRIESEVEQPR
jgi:hypothetical protein